MIYHERVKWWPTPIRIEMVYVTRMHTTHGPGWRVIVGASPEKTLTAEGYSLERVQSGMDRILEAWRAAQTDTRPTPVLSM